MRNLVLFLLTALFASVYLSAQVKIGDNPQNIDVSSVLELESTDKVLVITRVTTAQMNAIAPNQGALCFNTDLQSVHFYDGAQWVSIGGGGGTGGPLTADPIVNAESTIVITPTGTGDNLEVAPESITSNQIKDGSITGTDIADGSIGPGKIQDLSITQEKLSENSVGAFALDNDNFGVSAFMNDAGYITAGDITSVSTDADNSIITGSDGGAFYDDTNLLNDVVDNATAIAADNDQSITNEIQGLTIVGQQLTISDGNTVTIPAGATADGSETVVTAGTNVTVTGIGTMAAPYVVNAAGGGTPADGSETIINPTATVTVAGTGTTLDPYLLTAVGGGAGTTEEVDEMTLTGVGTPANPFEIKPSLINGQYLRTDATGNVVWDNLPSGTGGSVASDGMTIVGDGADATTELMVPTGGITDVQILDATILAEDLNQMGATAGQVLIWDDVAGVWAPGANAGGGGAVITDLTLNGDGSSIAAALGLADDAVTTAKILDANVTDAKIAPGGADQILRTAADGLSVAWTDLPTGSASIVDATLVGDGSSVATALGLADDAVTTVKILDANVTDAKIAPGAANQILRTAADGLSVAWADLPTSSTSFVDATLVGDGSSAATALGLADDAVTTAKIANATILAEDLNAMGATADGEILQWDTALNAGAGGWEVAVNAGHTGTPDQIFFAATTTGVPTGTNELVWNQTAIAGAFPALGIGIDPLGVQSAKAKVHIMENYPLTGDPISYGLQLQNRSTTNGTAVGMIFSVDDWTTSYGKGGLVFERTGDWAVGDFHFLQNNATGMGTDVNPTLADKAFTITKDKDLGIYGGIDIGGAGTGFGANNQVLASGGPGNPVKWVAAGGSGNNLETTNLVQPTATLARTFEVTNANQNLMFTGLGRVGVGNFGVGTAPTNPENKFHVLGAIRSEGILNSNGTENIPAYRFSGDTDTGMFWSAADELGFSVGEQAALVLKETVANGLEVISNGSLELKEQLLDKDGDA
ncbi:MAG: beta strand repeat-containing protein, partial [Maribacter sp.]